MTDRINERTGAQQRADIDRGLTGDKKPGFDPAAAPMETDSEAGGSAMVAPLHGAGSQHQPADGRDWQGSEGDAMRNFSQSASKARAGWALPLGVGLLVVVLLGLWALA